MTVGKKTPVCVICIIMVVKSVSITELTKKNHCDLSPEGFGWRKLLANSFLILLIVGDWRSLSLPELVRPVVEVASKAEKQKVFKFLSLSFPLFSPALEVPAPPLVSARLASRACGVSHSLGRHRCKKGTQVDMYASLLTQAGTSLNILV